MPINEKLLSAPSAHRKGFLLADIPIGMSITLSKDVVTASPDRKTYTAGSTGFVHKSYGTVNSAGFILQMGDGRKIPVALDFLNFPKPLTKPSATSMPLPYQTV